MSVMIPQTSGVSDEQLEAAEQQLGCSLPPAWREFVRRHDGATPTPNTFDVPGNQSGVRAFVPVLQAAVRRQQVEGFPPHGVPMAEDDCGNYVWLDPRSGAVFFWDHELNDPSALIAPDVEAFVVGLQPFDASSVKLEPGQVISAWVHPDFKSQF